MCDSCGCQKPEEHKVDPAKCSPEQIKECHGDVEGHPCVEAGPGGGHPEECSPEQIKKCHGDAKEHPCVSPGEEKQE